MALQRIEIRPSRCLAIALCLAHLAAAAAIWFAALPSWLTSGLIAAIGAGLGTLLIRAMLRPAGSIVELEITAAGRMSFLSRSGTWHACELLGTTYVSPRLTILNLSSESGRFVHHVVLLPDNVDAQDFRRLRTWLRWKPRPESRNRSTGENGKSTI